eukprot:1161555-Pelagomonas_calceolata.AAC.3
MHTHILKNQWSGLSISCVWGRPQILSAVKDVLNKVHTVLFILINKCLFGRAMCIVPPTHFYDARVANLPKVTVSNPLSLAELRFEVVKDGIVNANPKITTYTVKAPPLRPKQSLSCKQEVDEGQIIPELTGQEA